MRRARRLTLAASIAAAALAALTPAGAARADNAEALPHTSALVTITTTGHTAGHVRACVKASGGPVRVVSFRVHDYSRGVMTRMGGGGRVIRSGHAYCARTGNWFRLTRSFVTVGVVDQATGARSFRMIPVN